MFFCGELIETIFPDPRTANALAIAVQVLYLALSSSI
jgi:hypothetical protein